MVNQIFITAVIKEEEQGYSVFCPEVGVASQGETFEECIANIKEAVELYIESFEELGRLDEILDQLGVSEEDLKNGKIIPKIITTNIPIEVALGK